MHTANDTHVYTARTQISKQQIKQTLIWLQFDYERQHERASEQGSKRTHKKETERTPQRQHPLTQRDSVRMHVCVYVLVCVLVCDVKGNSFVCPLRQPQRDSRAHNVRPTGSSAQASFARTLARSLARSILLPYVASPFQSETNSNNNNKSALWCQNFGNSSCEFSWNLNVYTRKCNIAVSGGKLWMRWKAVANCELCVNKKKT